MIETLKGTSGGSVAVDLLHFYRPVPRADYVKLLGKDVGAFRALSASTSGPVAEVLESAAQGMLTRLQAAVEASLTTPE